MLKLVIALVLVGTIAAADLVGSNRCTWGPSYWCKDLQSAKECEMIPHCREKVWKQEVAQPSLLDNNFCSFCQWAFAKARVVLEKNMTQSELENYVKSVCSILPDSAEKKTCNSFVESALPELVAMIIDDIEPAIICRAINLCPPQQQKETPVVAKPVDPVQTNEVKDYLVVTYHKVLTDDQICDDCTTVFTDVQKMINDSKDTIMNYIKIDLCNRLGIAGADCNKTIDEYAPVIFQLLQSEMDPATICKMLGFCKSRVTTPVKDIQSNPLNAFLVRGQPGAAATMKKISVSKTIVNARANFNLADIKASAQCILCEFVVDEIDDMLQKNKSQAAVVQALSEVCLALPNSVRAECQTFVTQYGGAIVVLITQLMDPKKICTYLGICTANGIAQVPAEPFPFSSRQSCQLCSILLNTAKQTLVDPKSQAEAVTYMQNLCHNAFQNQVDRCEAAVKSLTPYVMDFLANNLDAKKACQAAGLCP